MTVKWYGQRVERRLIEAVRKGIDDTTSAAALYAKRHHPGWQNRTSTAEGSIRMEPARVEGSWIRGRFGSFSVDYFIWLELKHGAALRNAADVEFPRLMGRIRGHWA
jgi:hypothetical protein